MKLPSRWFHWLVAASFYSGAALAQSIGTIAFSPAQPTSNDSVTVTLTPAAGQPNYCPLGFSVQGSKVYIGSFASSCTPGYGTTNSIVIGRLPAGTYEVTWTFVDNFFDEPVPTDTLIVTFAPVRVPALSFGALVLLASCLAFFGLRARRLPAHEP